MLMKQHLLFPLILILSLFLFISSCQKNNSVSNNYTEVLISKAQEWYSQNTKTSIPVLWGQAVISIDKSRIIVPLDWSAKTINGGKSFRKLIIYQDKQLNISNGEIIEVIPTFNYRMSNPIEFNWKRFTGSFGVYDLSLNFLYGQYVELGNLKHKAIFERYRSKEDFDKVPKRTACWWVQSSTVGGDGVFTVIHTQQCISFSDGNGGGDPGQQQPVNCKIDPDNPDPNQCTGGSGGDPYEPDPFTDIINNLTDSCKRRIADRIINSNIQSAVIDTFKRIFNTTKNYNVHYMPGSELKRLTGSILFDTATTVLGATTTFVKGSVLNVYVFTNDNLLQNASQEVIASIMVHEMVHGIMDYEGWDPLDQHEKMANEGFPEKLATIVRTMYPNLNQNPEIATNLQWAALSETNKYKTRIDPMFSNNAQWRSWAETTLLVYLEGSMGTPCQQ